MPRSSSNWSGAKAATSSAGEPYPITGEHIGILNKPAYADAAAIARKIIERVANDEIDAVYLIYNEFKSVMTQNADGQQGSSRDSPARRTDRLYLMSSRRSN